MHSTGKLPFGHGPDADDAFIFEPLIHGRVDAEGLEFEHRHLPFHELNRRAVGDRPLPVTMLSAAAFARVTDRYVALPFGGSFVETMGPMLVARRRLSTAEVAAERIAVPGDLTTAALLLRLHLPRARTFTHDYADIARCVAAGEAGAGVVIHEQQLDYERHGLVCIADLGLRWMKRNGLPTPLAVCAVRADLEPALRDRVIRVLRSSLDEARRAPEGPTALARDFSGGLDAAATKALIQEYVGARTYDLGETGRRAIRTLVLQAQDPGHTAPPRFADTLPAPGAALR